MSVIQMKEYLEKKEDEHLDSKMEIAQSILGYILAAVEYDSATTYFVWRNLSDILMQGMEWEPDLMRSGLEFDIDMAEKDKEVDHE